MFQRHEMQYLLSVDGGKHGPAFRSRESKVTGIGALAAGSALEGGLDFQNANNLGGGFGSSLGAWDSSE